VLIVDDNEHLRKILSSILRFSGYDIVEAKSGGEAIEKAASAQPGLILLDLNLPDMKGLDGGPIDKKESTNCSHTCYCV
jgi:CheY-like chemotaxis protein